MRRKPSEAMGADVACNAAVNAAVPAPGQCTEIALPVQLDAGTRAFVDLLGHALAHYRELELVRLDRALHLGVFQSGLDHLALVGLEDESFFLEIVDISLVHAFAIDEAELDEDKRCQCQHGYHRYPCRYFSTCTHMLFVI